jgi:PIN domain nuclease of toxin-antitoxin system
MPSVLDASAMLALAQNEPGAVVVRLALAVDVCLAHSGNLCEVYYTRMRQHGEDDAEAVLQFLIRDAGVSPYASPDLDFYREVGRLRALATSQRLALSLADCFCIATARATGGELLTCDHREFDPLLPIGLCAIAFIR